MKRMTIKTRGGHGPFIINYDHVQGYRIEGSFLVIRTGSGKGEYLLYMHCDTIASFGVREVQDAMEVDQ